MKLGELLSMNVDARCPSKWIVRYVELLDDEDRHTIRWSRMGVAAAIRGMRYRIEEEGFTVLNTWLLGQFLRAYLTKVGKLEGYPMNKCRVMVEVEREAIEELDSEAELARLVKERIGDLLYQGNVAVTVKVYEALCNGTASSICRLGFSRRKS